MKPNASSRLARDGFPGACFLAAAIAFATLLALGTRAQAAATTYPFTPTTAGTYAWMTAGNWSGGVPVGANDVTVAFFPNTTTALTGAVTVNTDLATLTSNTCTLIGLAAANATVNTTTTTAVAIGMVGQAGPSTAQPRR